MSTIPRHRRTAVLMASTAAVGLLAGRSAFAQSLQWQPQPVPGKSANTIAVAPNDAPFVSTTDGSCYYLGQVACSQPDCFPQLSWIEIPGTQGVSISQVSVNLDGLAFAVDSAGRQYDAVTGQQPNDTTGQIDAWEMIRDAPGTCARALVPGISTGFTEANVTPIAPQYIPVVWGLGCPMIDGGGDLQPMMWNLELTNYGTLYWQFNPGWELIAPGSGGVQMVLFTEGGASNAQVPWMRNAAGQLFSYNGYEFVKMPNPKILIRRGWTEPTPSWITDHYAVDAESIFQWSDASQAWQFYASGVTPSGTVILEISSSQAITTNGYGVVGPSRIWGIDQIGGVWVLTEQGTAQ